MDQIEASSENAKLEDPEYAAEMKAFRDQLEAETREQTIAAKKRIVRCVVSNVLPVIWVKTLMTKKMMAKIRAESYYVR